MEKLLEKMKACRKEQILILLLAGVLLLVIALPAGDGENGARTAENNVGAEGTEQETERDSGTQAERMERRLEEILSHVAGIGRTEVMLTLKSGGRRLVEKDTERSQERAEDQGDGTASVSEQSGGSESTVYIRDSQGNESPYVAEELEPEIAGVLVIAQGAGNASVAAEITGAVMALFGVEAHKIKVMKME